MHQVHNSFAEGAANSWHMSRKRLWEVVPFLSEKKWLFLEPRIPIKVKTKFNIFSSIKWGEQCKRPAIQADQLYPNFAFSSPPGHLSSEDNKMNTHTVSLQLNSEQEKTSLSFKLSLKKFHTFRNSRLLYTRPCILESPDEWYHLYYLDKESCRL